MIRSGVFVSAVFLLVLSLSLGSCSILNKTYPEKRLFSLDPESFLKSVQDQPAGSLIVKEFDIASVFDTNAFVYRMDEFRFETDYFNEFIVPVQQMVTEKIETGLIGTGLFVPYSGNDNPGKLYRLSGKITRICGDFREENSPEAVMEIWVRLERWDLKTAETVLSKRYIGKKAIRETAPHALVQGWNQGLERILAALIHDIINCL